MPRPGHVTVSASLAGAALLRLAALLVALVTGFAAIEFLVRRLTGRLHREASGRRRAVPVSAPHRPIELVAADLRRLGRELACVPSGMAAARRRGLLAAYDDVLLEAAESLEVPHVLGATPEGSGRDLERMRLLCSLEASGLRLDS